MAGGETKETEERLERLQGLLSGARGESRAARNLARVPKANVLFGVLLHAADRLRQAEELTELEEALLEPLRDGLGEEEVREWGRVYRESVTAGVASVGVHQSLRDRTVSQGYGWEDLAADLPAVTEEWKAQSNWSVVGPQALAGGGDFDSPEFIEGMREWGFAVTLPAHLAGDGQVGQAVEETPQEGEKAPGYFRLEYESFHVHRVVGDGSGRDEIRWLSGGRSDLGARCVPFVSYEFGGHETGAGQTPVFKGWRMLFEGNTGLGLATNVACWEWDTGDGTVNSFQEAMATLSNNLIFNTIWDAVGAAAPTVIGLLMEATSLAVTITNLVARNDLSCSRTLLLDQATLAMLSHRGSAQWHFNGDGHHELKVGFYGERVPFPAGTLEYAVRSRALGVGVWTGPVALPWPSTSAPALAAHAGRLYAAFVSPDEQAVMWASMDGNGNWTVPEQLGRDESYVAPALTSAHGKLIYAVTGKDDRVYFRTYTPSGGWTGAIKLPGGTPHSPTLATFANRAWLAHVGFDSRIYHSVYNGSSWTAWRLDNLGWRSAHHVAMAPGKLVGQPRMWRVQTGAEVHTAVNTSSDGSGAWLNSGTVPRWGSNHGPALAGNEATGALTILARGDGGQLWIADYDGSSWQGTRTVPGAAPQGAAAAAYFNNQLYTMYLR
ncbi:hypothetical protein ACFVVA_41895 [Kitasatospora sp. NPDC058048]|uniref:hypothetical protein n=1 Tax=Kitasatospora sp. NPDC058048 TaxID=3346313 RepID=UPI0036DB4407